MFWTIMVPLICTLVGAAFTGWVTYASAGRYNWVEAEGPGSKNKEDYKWELTPIDSRIGTAKLAAFATGSAILLLTTLIACCEIPATERLFNGYLLYVFATMAMAMVGAAIFSGGSSLSFNADACVLAACALYTIAFFWHDNWSSDNAHKFLSTSNIKVAPTVSH